MGARTFVGNLLNVLHLARGGTRILSKIIEQETTCIMLNIKLGPRIAPQTFALGSTTRSTFYVNMGILPGDSDPHLAGTKTDDVLITG